jgi:lysozyme family protein
MSAMDDDYGFQLAMVKVFRDEGGYVNDPADAGGETKYGISKRSYPNEDIKNLTMDRARQIYYRDWWQKYGYGKIVDHRLADKVFNTAINIGASRAHKILQRCVNANSSYRLVDDGVLGPKTLEAVNCINPEVLLVAFRAAQADYYRALVAAKPQNAKFLNGWLRRAAS